jgi:sec-independent protein translocase protein TatB
MFGIGTGELLLLLVIALLVLGPERMPKLARDVGRTVADLRKTSDELRTEFLNADQALRNPEKLLDLAAKAAPPAPPAAEPVIAPPAPAEASAPAPEATAPAPEATAPAPEATAPPDAGATQAGAAGDDDETAFDREAREARARLEDPEQRKEHEARAKAEGWTVPTDEAGTSPREG